ncbi:MAG TPA: YjbH domain-containing protein, partial [Alphaproteobacteria bacterium]|nr:YjbH domain-containing protein [Alphaproteobacteria bacterium]
SNHFGKDRTLDGEMPNEPSDWFTGEDVGLFAGVEYQTPLKGLSLVFDVGADRYAAERAAFDYQAPAPWGLGVRYQPQPWVNVQAGVQGADKIMARVSFQGSPGFWLGKTHKKDDMAPMQAHRTDMPSPEQARLEAEKYEIIVDSVVFDAAVGLSDRAVDGAHGAANLDFKPHRAAPYQLGRAMRALSAHAGPDVEEIAITPHAYGLRGPQVKLMRKDFERALALKQGSADEIWKNAEFDAETKGEHRPLMVRRYRPENLRLILDNDVSLAEEDSGVLYRSALIAELEGPTLWNAVHTGTSWRLNLKDNLARIDQIRPPSLLPVRSNVSDFTDMTVGMDRMYAALTHSFTPELHGMAAAGYLEEMYGGAGGELLWRPYGKRYALGVESWLALKRDPALALAAGFNGDSLLTGHLNGWYEFPDQNLTAYAKIGRFLAEDRGITAGLSHEFKNGAMLDGVITLTEAADFDLFGGTTHAYQGVKFTLPLGNVPLVPEGSMVRVKAAPLGRETGQALDAPLKLYEMTESFSAGHMAEYWDQVTE